MNRNDYLPVTIDINYIAKEYLIIKKMLIDMGYDEEIDWQYNVSIDELDESTFLQETAWVILCSGMKETIIRNIFPMLSLVFNKWESAEYITNNSLECKKKALFYFKNELKISAIITIANQIYTEGFSKIKNNIKLYGIDYLKKFPFIGPVTSFHLAKNIGLNTAKPDRHLKRIASKIGYDNVQELCEDISFITDNPIPVIDIVLWRFASIHRNKSTVYMKNMEEEYSSLFFTN